MDLSNPMHDLVLAAVPGCSAKATSAVQSAWTRLRLGDEGCGGAMDV
jgi:hypothetical protein